jgi:hypothetical protein
MRGSGGRATSYNTAFATLEKMKAVETRRKCPERYTKPYAGILIKNFGVLKLAK